ncbi:hypothetical protein [Dialister invisus]|uniref:hypothetical protein n=1 Tax=Dialister invisus TaxID=218538 RepID=UPI0023F8688C|nr:hypothetical protein [Dialister invisus]
MAIVLSKEDQKILRRQLELLAERSEQNPSISDLIAISDVMSKIEAVIMGYEQYRK